MKRTSSGCEGQLTLEMFKPSVSTVLSLAAGWSFSRTFSFLIGQVIMKLPDRKTQEPDRTFRSCKDHMGCLQMLLVADLRS